MRKKMAEVGVDIPDLLDGWHMLSRAGVPKWTHLQVKGLCSGELVYAKVTQALLKLFGGDHKPNARDLFKVGAGHAEAGLTVDYAEKADVYYDEVEEEPWFGDETYYEDACINDYLDDGEYEEEVPEELEQAADEAEDAFLNYVDSSKRMKELALARGFFPVVAMPPPDWRGPAIFGKSSSKGRGKGRGKSNGKGKGKGGEKGSFRRYAFNRRPASGIRKSAASNQVNGPSDAAKSTGSGSTANHGPRFKRYRLQDSGTKAVEDISMVEDHVNGQLEDAKNDLTVAIGENEEDILFSDVAPGQAIVDSGAAKSVVGSETWQRWISLLGRAGRQNEIKVEKRVRDFRFGDGSTLRSQMEVTFPSTLTTRKEACQLQ